MTLTYTMTLNLREWVESEVYIFSYLTNLRSTQPVLIWWESIRIKLSWIDWNVYMKAFQSDWAINQISNEQNHQTFSLGHVGPYRCLNISKFYHQNHIVLFTLWLRYCISQTLGNESSVPRPCPFAPSIHVSVTFPNVPHPFGNAQSCC